MILAIFGALALVAAAAATFFQDFRRAVLALWAAGIAVGAIYLTFGAEYLAVIQWIISTVVAITFSFFGIMFGQFRPSDEGRTEAKNRSFQEYIKIAIATLPGLALAGVITLGSRGLIEKLSLDHDSKGLSELGQSITQNHLLSLEILALTLLFTLIGGGVIARPDHKEGEK